MVKVMRSNPAEERDFDSVVPCRRTVRDIEEFPGNNPTPDELLVLREKMDDLVTSPEEAEVIEEILCSSCNELRTPR